MATIEIPANDKEVRAIFRVLGAMHVGWGSGGPGFVPPGSMMVVSLDAPTWRWLAPLMRELVDARKAKPRSKKKPAPSPATNDGGEGV